MNQEQKLYFFTGLFLFLPGLALLWAFVGLIPTLGVFLVVWGNNAFLEYRRLRQLSLRNFGLTRAPVFKGGKEMKEKMSETCASCKYSVKDSEGDVECHRDSPFTLYPKPAAVWPLVEEKDWCGEYRPKSE